MPPKGRKSSSVASPPRRSPRTTGRKTAVTPKISTEASADKSSSVEHNSLENRTTKKESQLSSIISPESEITPKSFPKSTPVVSSEAAASSFATNISAKDVGQDTQSIDVQSQAIPNMDSETTDRIGGEQTLAEKVSLTPEIAPVEAAKTVLETPPEGGAKTKTVVKKTIRIVKKMVKKKVPNKVRKDHLVSLKEVPEKLESSSNDGETPNFIDLGNVEIKNPNSIESVATEVENPKRVECVSTDVETSTFNDTVLMETESKPSVADSLEVKNPGLDAEKPKEAEVCERDKDGLLTENLSDIAGLNFLGAKSIGDESDKTYPVIETQLEDQIVISFSDQNHESKVESPNFSSRVGEGETVGHNEVKENVINRKSMDNVECNEVKEILECSDVKEKVENNEVKEHVENSELKENVGTCEVKEHVEDSVVKENCGNSESSGLKGKIGWGDGVILSGEMEALERRWRRKTEIFIGGLGKDTKEEDIRKIFEEVGEITEVRLMFSIKTGKKKGFAFLRYASAADAKRALEKYQKVEICGRQCGISPVEGNDTLFLGNIDKKWKSEDVVKLLQEIGVEKIDKVTVIADPNMIEFNRGFAFLELETNKDAQNAYKKLQKKGVFGKHLNIKVAWAEPLIEPDEKEILKVKSVYAEYLPSSWDEDKVKDCFRKFGEIENVVLAKDMPTSRRKDFAFVNYTTREAALACMEAFKGKQTLDEGSKVKVSLAKPIPKGKQIKQLWTPLSKELSKEKHKAPQPVLKLHESRNTGNTMNSKYEGIRVDQRSSTTSELVQLLREQASWKQTRPGSGIGSDNLEHSYPSSRENLYLPGRKRPFSAMGDNSHFSDSQGHTRARIGSTYPITSPSALTHGVGMLSLPLYHRQGAGYTSEPFYGVEGPPSYFQTRERAPSYGSSDIYRRY